MNLQNINLKGNLSDGQYSSLNFLERGGFGEIYTAQDNQNNQTVAIKIIPLLSYGIDKNLLQREAEIALSLKHDRIVTTHFFSSVQIDKTEVFYSVMDYLPNGNLESHIETSGGIAVQDCISFLLDIIDGLIYAHKTIIHRDLKPKNLLIDSDRRIKICDFGLSKLAFESTRTDTFKGGGTYYYMAPEAWTLETNTATMDLYSLGVIAFKLLTNSLPFSGKDIIEIRNAHLYSGIPDLKTYRQDIPLKLIEIINKLLSKRPEDRYNDALAVKQALESVDAYQQPKKHSILAELAARKISNKTSTVLDPNPAHFQLDVNF